MRFEIRLFLEYDRVIMSFQYETRTVVGLGASWRRLLGEGRKTWPDSTIRTNYYR